MGLETVDGKNFWLKSAITCPFKPFGKVKHKCIRCRETIPQQYLFCLKLNKGIVLKEDLRELLKENIKLYQFKMVKLRDKPHMNENQKVSQRIFWNGKIDKNKELLAELGKEEK